MVVVVQGRIAGAGRARVRDMWRSNGKVRVGCLEAPGGMGRLWSAHFGRPRDRRFCWELAFLMRLEEGGWVSFE